MPTTRSLLRARVRLARLAAAIVLAAAAAPAPAQHRSEERVAAEWVQDELRPFSGLAELRRYMRDIRRAGRVNSRRNGDIFVTGSRVVPRNASITNVQEAGVDEGDVVKQIGNFLIVLNDGRLFSIDTRAGGATGLALADRANVYRSLPPPNAAEADWYDEMLVRGDRILVTGYSYAREASELSVFRLTEDGRFVREGVFAIGSDDYYSRRNYATRLVGDDLIIYTPSDLHDFDGDAADLPTVRRIEPDAAADSEGRRRPLLDMRNLYGPLLPTLDPLIHSISVCPLAGTGARRDLSCRTRAFIGPRGRNFYVSRSHMYLWVGPDRASSYASFDNDCAVGHRAAHADAQRAIVYRVPIRPGDPEAVPVRGEPFDQFSFDEEGGSLRALVRWRSVRCWPADGDAQQLAYLALPLSRFSRHVIDAPASDFTALPPVAGYEVANRFTPTHLAYAPLNEVSYDNDEDDDEDRPPRIVASRLVVVPLARPGEPSVHQLTHNVRRLELIGNGLLVGGNSAALPNTASLTHVAVDGSPRIASAIDLPERFDGEGRSHAFNLRLHPDGSGLFALPTTALRHEEADDPWWSLPSDISYFTLDREGRIQAVGLLESRMPRYLQREDVDEKMLDGEPDEDIVPGYSCEVSCVDWYGNSRPIFTDGRIFALSGNELIEGRLENGRVVEVQRLDFARAVPGR